MRRTGIILLSLLAGFCGPVSARAQDNTVSVTLEDALDSYESGEVNLALMQAKLAAADGDAQAMALAGYILRQQGQFDEAAQWFSDAAIEGDTDAMVALADMAMKSEGGKTPEDASGWLMMAADADEPRADAMFALYQLYDTGAGGIQSDTESAFWLEQAAVNGHPEALKLTGAELEATDPDAASVRLDSAALSGDPEAQYLRALNLSQNAGSDAEDTEAFKLMRASANAGWVPAMSSLGLMYYQGVGTSPDFEKAATWFKSGAEAGDAEAQYLWAFALTKGEGTEQDFGEAYYQLLTLDPRGDAQLTADRDRLKAALEANVDGGILSLARIRASKSSALDSMLK